MGTSAHLLRKYAPAAVGRPGPRTRTGTAGWTRRSRGPPYSMERATGHPRICFANTHRLQWHTEIRGSAGAKRAESTIPEIFLAPWSGQRDVRVFAPQIRTGCGRSPRIHGDDGENFVELAVPSSPALGGAGNGTSAYLLRKSAPASGACRRLRLLAINASRLFNARTLSGSSPGTLLKKAR